MKLIVGLGNPGLSYMKTRHNIGFVFLDEIIKKYNFKIDKEKFSGKYTIEQINDEKIIFLKPQTYMNLSGESISKFVEFYKIKTEDILVIYDDIDLDVGRIRLKRKGSSGGHNGVENIIECLGTENFNRLKIGISKDELIDTKDYVLGKFTEEDEEVLTKIKPKVVELFEDFLNISFDELMKKYNS